MPNIVTLSLNPAIDVSSEADEVRSTQKVRTRNETYDAGGGGINVARVITELGGDVETVCLAGGVTGALLIELLDRDGVRHHTVPISGNTRISFTVHELTTGLEYRFVANGPSISAEETAAMLATLESLDFSFLVASGSLPAGMAAEVLVIAAESARRKRAKFVLDSSGEGLRTTLDRSRVHLVKPSLDELEWLAGAKLDEVAAGHAALDIVRRGRADIVAVTLGPDGVLCVTKDRSWRIPAIAVDARSTVGAGDSFLAAMVLSLSRDECVERSLLHGLAAGAAAVLTPGTKLCRRGDVETLLQQARALPIKTQTTGR